MSEKTNIRSPSDASYKFRCFPNSKMKEFRVLKECQNLAADVFNASANAPREYRFTICKIIHEKCCNLVHSVRLANSYELGTENRRNEQENVKEIIQQIDDLLPVFRKCRCITRGQEGEITRKVGNLKFSFEKWLESDYSRTEKNNRFN